LPYGDTFKEARDALAEVVWSFIDANAEMANITTLELVVLTVKHYTRNNVG
jgi:hypothetical protein